MSDDPIVLSDFMCTCDSDGRREAAACLSDVKDRLECNASDLLSSVVMSLNWDFHTYITEIYNDHWSVVHAETYPRDGEPQIKFSIQCDRVEHGIARLWQMCDDLRIFAEAAG